MSDSTFNQALVEARREFARLQERDVELGRELELNQAEILRYKGVIMAIEQLLGHASQPEAGPRGAMLRELLAQQERQASGSPNQVAQIKALLRRHPLGLDRSELEELMLREGIVGAEANDKRAAINSALWRAVKSGHVERDGEIYRLPRSLIPESAIVRQSKDGRLVARVADSGFRRSPPRGDDA